jgi:DNA-directed RNA polymerase subunit RPC12/RpoP
MAYYCCMDCGHEAHFVEFVTGTNSSQDDFVGGEDSDGNDSDHDEVDMACPVCDSSVLVEL